MQHRTLYMGDRGREENGHNEKKGGRLGWLIRKRKKETLMHF